MTLRFFSGTANPFPLAIFRIFLYCGIALHFWPSLFFLSENYAPLAFREMQWNQWLFNLLPQLPSWAPYLMAALLIAACVSGMLGLLPRTSALLALMGTYVFVSFNSIHLQTLALSAIWSALPIIVISGAGSEALSVRNVFKGEKARRTKQWAVGLLLAQLLIGFFFAGIEKLIAGWPMTNEMWLLLNYPQGFMVRDWIFSAPLLQTVAFGFFLSGATVLIELLAPFFLLWRKSRMAMLVVYQLFFVGVVAALEVPPLFWFIYAGGALLVLDDHNLSRLKAEIEADMAPDEPMVSNDESLAQM